MIVRQPPNRRRREWVFLLFSDTLRRFAHSPSTWKLLVSTSGQLCKILSTHHTWQTRFIYVPSVKIWYKGAFFLGRTSTYFLLVIFVGSEGGGQPHNFWVGNWLFYHWAKSPRYYQARSNKPRHSWGYKKLTTLSMDLKFYLPISLRWRFSAALMFFIVFFW